MKQAKEIASAMFAGTLIGALGLWWWGYNAWGVPVGAGVVWLLLVIYDEAVNRGVMQNEYETSPLLQSQRGLISSSHPDAFMGPEEWAAAEGLKALADRHGMPHPDLDLNTPANYIIRALRVIAAECVETDLRALGEERINAAQKGTLQEDYLKEHP